MILIFCVHYLYFFKGMPVLKGSCYFLRQSWCTVLARRCADLCFPICMVVYMVVFPGSIPYSAVLNSDMLKIEPKNATFKDTALVSVIFKRKQAWTIIIFTWPIQTGNKYDLIQLKFYLWFWHMLLHRINKCQLKQQNELKATNNMKTDAALWLIAKVHLWQSAGPWHTSASEPSLHWGKQFICW